MSSGNLLEICLAGFVDTLVSLLCLGRIMCFRFLFLVVNTSAVDCLERLISKMTYYVSLGPTHSLSPLVSPQNWYVGRCSGLFCDTLYTYIVAVFSVTPCVCMSVVAGFVCLELKFIMTP